MVYRESGRRPAFLVAAKSMKRRVVGFLAKSLLSSAHKPYDLFAFRLIPH